MNELGICEQDMYEQGMNEQEVNGQGISELGRLENLSGDMEKNPYRPYYFENPAAYDSPIRSWEEFRGRFRTEFAAHMPKEAPTYMNPFLEESAYFFPNPKDEVALVVNCGYCPPFLHRLAFVKIVYVLRGSCFFFIGGERILMKKGSFCLVGPNVEQAVYSCNDEDIVVNLTLFFICGILFGIDAGTRDYVGISLANAVQQNGQWLSDVRWKRGKNRDRKCKESV